MKKEHFTNMYRFVGFAFNLKNLFLLLVLIGFFHTTGFSKSLVVGAMDFPPYYVFDEKGDNISGINVDIVTSVLDAINEEYVIKGYPVKRLYSNIVKGKCNIFYGIRVPDKVLPSQKVLYSKNKISKIDLRVYSLGDTPVVQKKEDLIGKSIIVLRGYGYGGFIRFLTNPKTNIKVQIADGQDYAFKMLKKKRADYLLAFERPAKTALSHLAEEGFALQNLKQSPSMFLADGYFIVSKSTPGAQALLARMETAYEDLVKGGAFKGLIVE